jgi:hypothetical protein
MPWQYQEAIVDLTTYNRTFHIPGLFFILSFIIKIKINLIIFRKNLSTDSVSKHD